MGSPEKKEQATEVAGNKSKKERVPLLPLQAQQSSRAASLYSPTPENSDSTLFLAKKPSNSLNTHTRDFIESSEDDSEPNALDGGYGWVIVLGSFLSQLIIGGLVRCDGIYFLEFDAQFRESAQLTAWPGAVSVTLQCLAAPGFAWFCNRYSVRTCVILGTMFNIAGLVATAFAPNIYLLFLSFSVLQGLGRSMTLGPSIYVINMYFDKYRGIAMGLATAGTGIGTFALVPLVDWIFTQLGYKNAFLVVAAISSSGFICAALFRPFSWHMEMVRERRLKARMTQGSPIEKPSIHIGYSEGGSVNNAYTAKTTNDGLIYTPSEPGRSVQANNDGGNSIMTNGAPNTPSSTRLNDSNQVVIVDSLQNSPQNQTSGCCHSCIKVVFPVEGENNGKNAKRGSLFHWSLFKDIPFLLLCTSMTLFSLSHKTILTFLPAIGEEQGLSEIQASLLLSMVGVGDTVGRIATGFVLDMPKVRPFRESAYSAVLFLAAGVACVVPFTTTFALLCTAGFFFGFFTGASASQRPSVLANMLGKETVNSAIGILTSFRGIGTFVGPPLSGAMKDISGDFKTAFFMCSGNMAGAGAFVALSIVLCALRKRWAQPSSDGYQHMESDTPIGDDSDVPGGTIHGDFLSPGDQRDRDRLTQSLLSSCEG